MGCGAGQKAAAKPLPPVAAAKAPATGVAPAVTADVAPKGPEVPPKMLSSLKAAFESVDVNKSGCIDASELSGLLEKVAKEIVSNEDRDELLKAMDKDGSGKIEFRELVDWVLSKEGANDAVANWSLNKGLSDVHQAAIKGDADLINKLIDGGQKVNACDLNDVTPLHYAARCGKPFAAAALLEKKADLSARTSDTKRMPIHAAADAGSVEVVELLLAAKAEVNILDGRDRSPLHWACASSREEAAAILMAAGADVHAKSAAGYTPFAMAQDWSTCALADVIAAKGGTR